MTRDELLDHVRPRVEQLAGDIATMLWDRLELLLDQALDAARSALESELAVGHRDIKPANVSSDDVSSRHAEERGTSTTTEPPRSTRAASPSSRSRAPSSDLSSPRRQKSCSKCGAVGFTSAGCGRTHNVSATPNLDRVFEAIEDEIDEESEKTEAPPPGCAKARTVRRHRGIGAQARRRTAGAADHLRNLN
jgi:hypothetical protein